MSELVNNSKTDQLVIALFEENTENQFHKVKALVDWLKENKGTLIQVPCIRLRPFGEIPSQSELGYEFRDSKPYHESPEVMNKLYLLIGELRARIPRDQVETFMEWSKLQSFKTPAYFAKAGKDPFGKDRHS